MFSTKLVLLLAAAATAAPSVLGYAKYSPLIPNGEAMGKSLGHTDKDYTPFGSLFSKNGKTWAGVCKEKWPGQATLTVGAVLGDPCCTWTSGNPDFVLSAPNTAGTTCKTDAAKAPATTPAAATPAASSAAPAAGATATKSPAAQVAPGPAPAPSTPQLPGKVQPANPAPGAGATGPVPAPVPAAVPLPGKAGNATVPAPGSGAAPVPTPAASKPAAGKATGPTKICK